MGNYLKFLRTTSSIQEVQHRSMIQTPQRPNNEGSTGVMNKLFKLGR